MPHGRHTSLTVSLTPAERQTLTAWQRMQAIPAGRARRARLILLVADGLRISQVAARVGISRRFVYKWVRRFQAQGLPGLADLPRPRPGPPPGASPRETMPGENGVPSRRA